MYKLLYDQGSGKVSCIMRGNDSIPICEDNTDYQEFLEWNKEQKVPLDLKSIYEPTLAEIQAKVNAEAIRKLAEIDLKSIRSLRAKEPQFIKQLEKEAIAERAKIK